MAQCGRSAAAADSSPRIRWADVADSDDEGSGACAEPTQRGTTKVMQHLVPAAHSPPVASSTNAIAGIAGWRNGMPLPFEAREREFIEDAGDRWNEVAEVDRSELRSQVKAFLVAKLKAHGQVLLSTLLARLRREFGQNHIPESLGFDSLSQLVSSQDFSEVCVLVENGTELMVVAATGLSSTTRLLTGTT